MCPGSFSSGAATGRSPLDSRISCLPFRHLKTARIVAAKENPVCRPFTTIFSGELSSTQRPLVREQVQHGLTALDNDLPFRSGIGRRISSQTAASRRNSPLASALPLSFFSGISIAPVFHCLVLPDF